MVGACLVIAPVTAEAVPPGVVVGNSGGKDTLQFRQWQEFRRNVDEKSNGTLLLDYLIFGELGTPREMLQAVEKGRADIGSFGCAGITQEIPEMAVTAMPYLFTTDDEAAFVFDRYLSGLFTAIADQHGLVFLQWGDAGWQDLYARSPVQLPAQLDGHAIRTPGNIAGPRFLRALGATPVEMGVTEVAGSVQSQKVFAAFGGLNGFVRFGATDYKYLTETRHAYNCGIVVANKSWFDSATPREQAILRSSYPSSADIRRQVAESEKAVIGQLSARGVTLLELTPEERNAWAAVGLPLYPDILREAGGRAIEVYDAIRAGKQDFLRQTPVASDAR